MKKLFIPMILSSLVSMTAWAGADLMLTTATGVHVNGFKISTVAMEIDPGTPAVATLQLIARNADGKYINVNLDGFAVAEVAALNTVLGGGYATLNGAPSIALMGSSVSLTNVQQVPSLIPGRDFYRGAKGTVLMTTSRTTP